jgi:hypothetical protein
MVAVQWGGPREQVVPSFSGQSSLVVDVDRATPAAGGLEPAPVTTPVPASVNVIAPAAPPPAKPGGAFDTVPVLPSGAVFEPASGISAPPPAAAKPVPAPPPAASAAAAAPAPASAAAPKRPSLPAWYVEDDPAMLDPTHRAAGAALGQSSAATEAVPPPAAAPPEVIAARRMMVTADVDVRSGPDARAPSLGVLKAGSVIAVGECAVWCEVTINARSGWVFYSFLADPSAFAAAAR